MDGLGNLVTLPTSPDIQLWPDAMEKLEIAAPSSLSPNNEKRIKVLSLSTRFDSVPKPLRAIYWLSVHNKREIEIKELEGAERFRAVGTLSYNSHIAEALLDRAVYLRKAAAISKIPILRLYRPREKWSVEELSEICSSNLQV